MAKVEFLQSYDMSDLTLGYDEAFAENVAKKRIQFSFSASERVDKWRGKKITVSGDLNDGATVTGGKVKSFVSLDGPDKVAKFKNLKADAPTVFGEVLANDAQGLFTYLLRDEDGIKGSDFDDILNSFDGDDKVKGKAGDDVIDGGAGNDRLLGQDGADELLGGAGNDVLKGGEGDDFLAGSNAGINDPNEIDVLVGGAGIDVFAIGDGFGEFYDQGGDSDYALLKGFDLEDDVVQIAGELSDYDLQTVSLGARQGTGIYRDGDLLAIVKDVSVDELTLVFDVDGGNVNPDAA